MEIDFQIGQRRMQFVAGRFVGEGHGGGTETASLLKKLARVPVCAEADGAVARAQVFDHLETADADGAGGPEDGDPFWQATPLYRSVKNEQAPVYESISSRKLCTTEPAVLVAVRVMV